MYKNFVKAVFTKKIPQQSTLFFAFLKKRFGYFFLKTAFTNFFADFRALCVEFLSLLNLKKSDSSSSAFMRKLNISLAEGVFFTHYKNV